MSDSDDFNRQLQELIRRLQQGDAKAGEELVDLLEAPLLTRLRQKVPADRLKDVYQETWARFFEGILEGKCPDSPVAWFLGIARFVNFEHGREDGRTYELPESVERVLESRQASLEKFAIDGERTREVEKCLDKLPDRYRGFLLGHVRGDERERLCDQWKVNPPNYAKFLHRVRQALLKCLGWSSLGPQL